MDSPVFGTQKSHHYPKNQNPSETNCLQSEYPILNWHTPSKSQSNYSSQISDQLKLAYTLLTIQKSIKSLFAKINNWYYYLYGRANKKKYQAFQKIRAATHKSQSEQKNSTIKSQKKTSSFTFNPQIKPLHIICLGNLQETLQKMCFILDRLQLKKKLSAWSSFQISNKKVLFPKYQNAISYVQPEPSISNKVETKKQMNSKKHAREMKQNSMLNHSSPDYETENERLAQELSKEEYNLERFTQKINNLLSYHESRFAVDSDRDTWLSDNGVSHSSFQNHKVSLGTKNQSYKKK